VYDIYSSECGTDADEIGTLCILRNDTLLFDHPDYDSCWYAAVATENISQDLISIYPNPSSTDISVETKGHLVQKVSVIDLLGNVIFIEKGLEVDISFLPSGYYFLQIELENQRVVMKQFVKQ